MSVENAALATAALLTWVALVHVLMASGVRRGELVWSGKQPRLLAPPLRVRSFVYALLLVSSAGVLATATGAVEMSPIPDRWVTSATFAVTAFLGLAFLYSVVRGSRWERMLFAPITLLGALLAGWLTFVA
jgi:hypothetical protein